MSCRLRVAVFALAVFGLAFAGRGGTAAVVTYQQSFDFAGQKVVDVQSSYDYQSCGYVLGACKEVTIAAPVALPRFDPALGTLTRVEWSSRITATVSGSAPVARIMQGLPGEILGAQIGVSYTTSLSQYFLIDKLDPANDPIANPPAFGAPSFPAADAAHVANNEVYDQAEYNVDAYMNSTAIFNSQVQRIGGSGSADADASFQCWFDDPIAGRATSCSGAAAQHSRVTENASATTNATVMANLFTGPDFIYPLLYFSVLGKYSGCTDVGAPGGCNAIQFLDFEVAGSAAGEYAITYHYDEAPAAVPAPGPLAAIGAGLLAFALRRRRG